jgi:hypothetical protein
MVVRKDEILLSVHNAAMNEWKKAGGTGARNAAGGTAEYKDWSRRLHKSLDFVLG